MCVYVGKVFQTHPDCTQIMVQRGSIYSSQSKDQTEFMSKLHDDENDCSLANKDEIVKFSFLIHNTNERVKDQLIEKMKTMDTLTDILQLAKTVESRVQTETLSKQLLQNVGKSNIATEVHAVQKDHTSVKTNVSNQILEVPVVGNHPAGIKVERSVVIVVVPTSQSNVLPVAKHVSNVRRKIISQNSVGSSDKKPVGWGCNHKCFSRKDILEVKKQI